MWSIKYILLKNHMQEMADFFLILVIQKYFKALICYYVTLVYLLLNNLFITTNSEFLCYISFNEVQNVYVV